MLPKSNFLAKLIILLLLEKDKKPENILMKNFFKNNFFSLLKYDIPSKGPNVSILS